MFIEKSWFSPFTINFDISLLHIDLLAGLGSRVEPLPPQVRTVRATEGLLSDGTDWGGDPVRGDNPDQALGVVGVQVQLLHGVVVHWGQQVAGVAPRQLLETSGVVVHCLGGLLGGVIDHVVLSAGTLSHLGEHLAVALGLDGVVLPPDVGVAQQGLAGVNVDLGVVRSSVSLWAPAVVVVEHLNPFKNYIFPICLV